MDIQELKQKTNLKVLTRGKSGYGKTYRACRIALMVAAEGVDVLYVDTEAEAAETFLQLIEDGEFTEDDLENVEYQQVESHEELMEAVSRQNQKGYGLMVVDTLDDKHTMAMYSVMGEMSAGGDDFGIYPQIYSEEKKLMHNIRKPRTNVLACIDPDSGKMDKPKDCQTNVHGRFTVVIDLMKSDGDYGHKVKNWIMKDEAIGKQIPDLEDALADKFLERVE